MTIKLPTHDRQDRTTETPSYLRRNKEASMDCKECGASETDSVTLGAANTMRKTLSDVSVVIDRIITGQIRFDDVAIELNDLNVRVESALGEATAIADECPDNVLRPNALARVCRHCGDQLSDWSKVVHRECRLAIDLAKNETPD